MLSRILLCLVVVLFLGCDSDKPDDSRYVAAQIDNGDKPSIRIRLKLKGEKIVGGTFSIIASSGHEAAGKSLTYKLDNLKQKGKSFSAEVTLKNDSAPGGKQKDIIELTFSAPLTDDRIPAELRNEPYEPDKVEFKEEK